MLDIFEDRERARRIDAADARLAVLSCGAGELAAAARLTRHRLPGACFPFLLLRFGPARHMQPR